MEQLATFMRLSLGMTKTVLSTLGALALATSLGAQPQTPATQPVRPPDRPPTGEPAPPPRAPDVDLGRAKRGSGDGESGKGDVGEPEPGTLTLKGCLQRVAVGGFRLHPIEGDDASVTSDVRLGGDVEKIGEHVGRVVEVRGTYVQDTPATTKPASFSVERVKALTGTCPAK